MYEITIKGDDASWLIHADKISVSHDRLVIEEPSDDYLRRFRQGDDIITTITIRHKADESFATPLDMAGKPVCISADAASVVTGEHWGPRPGTFQIRKNIVAGRKCRSGHGSRRTSCAGRKRTW